MDVSTADDGSSLVIWTGRAPGVVDNFGYFGFDDPNAVPPVVIPVDEDGVALESENGPRVVVDDCVIEGVKSQEGETLTYGCHVWGKLVAEDGSTIRDTFQISQSPIDSRDRDITAIWNSTESEWLVVWSHLNEANARVVTNQGATGTPVSIVAELSSGEEPGRAVPPAAAFVDGIGLDWIYQISGAWNPDAEKYMIVWVADALVGQTYEYFAEAIVLGATPETPPESQLVDLGSLWVGTTANPQITGEYVIPEVDVIYAPIDSEYYLFGDPNPIPTDNAWFVSYTSAQSGRLIVSDFYWADQNETLTLMWETSIVTVDSWRNLEAKLTWVESLGKLFVGWSGDIAEDNLGPGYYGTLFDIPCTPTCGAPVFDEVTRLSDPVMNNSGYLEQFNELTREILDFDVTYDSVQDTLLISSTEIFNQYRDDLSFADNEAFGRALGTSIINFVPYFYEGDETIFYQSIEFSDVVEAETLVFDDGQPRIYEKDRVDLPTNFDRGQPVFEQDAEFETIDGEDVFQRYIYSAQDGSPVFTNERALKPEQISVATTSFVIAAESLIPEVNENTQIPATYPQSGSYAWYSSGQFDYSQNGAISANSTGGVSLAWVSSQSFFDAPHEVRFTSIPHVVQQQSQNSNGTPGSSLVTIPEANPGTSLKLVKVVTGFQKGKAELSAQMKRVIQSRLDAVSSETRVTCVGRVQGKSLTPKKRSLALARANAACDFISEISPRLQTQVDVKLVKGKDKNPRAVRILIY